MKNRLALVTGAGRGIGRAITQCLAGEGAHVAAVSRTKSDIESLIEAIGGTEKGHLGVTLDLTLEEAPSQLFKILTEKFGEPSIVVHNLGGTLDIKDPFCSIADWRRVYRFNFEVAVELNILLVPPMQ